MNKSPDVKAVNSGINKYEPIAFFHWSTNACNEVNHKSVAVTGQMIKRS